MTEETVLKITKRKLENGLIDYDFALYNAKKEDYLKLILAIGQWVELLDKKMDLFDTN